MIRLLRFAVVMMLRSWRKVRSMLVVLVVVLATFHNLAMLTRLSNVCNDLGAIIMVSSLPGMVSKPRTRTIVVFGRGRAFDTTAPWLMMVNAVSTEVGSSDNILPRAVRCLMAGVLFPRRGPPVMKTSILIAERFTPICPLLFCQIATCRKRELPMLIRMMLRLLVDFGSRLSTCPRSTTSTPNTMSVWAIS